MRRGRSCSGSPFPPVSNHPTSHAGYDREIDRMILEVHVITGAALSSEIAQPFTLDRSASVTHAIWPALVIDFAIPVISY